MDYPRYKPSRPRPAGKGAFSDYAAVVLSGNVVAPKRPRAYRAWRREMLLARAGKTEG
jgi:hypothetical protein